MDKKTALLIIDVQKGMFDTENISPIYDGENFPNRLETLIQEARSLGLPVIYIQHCGPKGHLLEKGTTNFEIHPQIAPLENDPVIQKETSDSFNKTTLESKLNRLKVSNLIIAGIQTEFCVDTTCRIAFSKGYQITLVADCHTTWDTENIDAKNIIKHHNRIIGNGFGKVQPLSEINFRDLT